MGKRIFISHKTEDIEKTRKICKILKKHRINYWMSNEHISLSQDYDKSISKTIGNSAAVLFLLSKKSQDSNNCIDELNQAIKLNKDVIIWKVEDVEPNSFLQLELGNVNVIDVMPFLQKKKPPHYKEFWDSRTKELIENYHVNKPIYPYFIGGVFIVLFILFGAWGITTLYDWVYEIFDDGYSQTQIESGSSDDVMCWSDYIEFNVDNFFMVDTQIIGLTYDELGKKLDKDLPPLEDASEVVEGATQSEIDFEDGSSLYFVFVHDKLYLVNYTITNDYSFNSIRNAASNSYGDYTESDGYTIWELNDCDFYLVEGKHTDNSDYGLMQIYISEGILT